MADYDFETAMEIVDEGIFLVDKDTNTFYVEYIGANKAERCVPVSSREYQTFLRQEYRRRTNECFAPTFKNELLMKKDEAFEDEASHVRFYRRVKGSIKKGKIIYSLNSKQKSAISVSIDNWKPFQTKKVHFLDSNATKNQVEPKGGGNLLELLRPYFNLPHDAFLLFVICLVQSFSRDSDHFAMIISGQKGTGKSTMTEIFREIIDPSELNKSLTPKSVDDLIVNLFNSFIVSIDNAKPLSEDMSNTLCAAITGASAVKRELFTNDSQVIMKLYNIVLINGIDIIPKKSDLVDRALLFEPQKITKEKRLSEQELMEQFRSEKPAILGAIMDVLVEAMKQMPNVKPSLLHRMADAHREMIAIALALGISQENFEKILNHNIWSLQNAYSSGNDFVDAVTEYVNLNGKQDGPVTKIYKRLYLSIPGSKKYMPGSPSSFSRKMKEEQEAFRINGIRFHRYKKNDANYITIERIPQSQQSKGKRKAEPEQHASTED